MSRQRIPVIVGFGGINAAGRSSGHHAYGRMVYPALPAAQRQRTLASLATLMAIKSGNEREQYILDHSLIRRIETGHFDVDAVNWNQRFPVESNGLPARFELARKHLPDAIPPNWLITP